MADTETREETPAASASSTESDERGRAGREDAGKPKGGQGAAGEAPKDKKKDRQRQIVLIVIGLAGVVVAYVTMTRSGSASGSPVAVPALGNGDVAGSGLGAGGDAAAGLRQRLGTLQHLLEQQGAQLRTEQRQINKLAHPHPGVHPQGHFITGKAAKALTYLRDRATGAIYQVNPNGTRYKLKPWQYAALGRPHLHYFGHGKYGPKHHPGGGEHKPHPNGRGFHLGKGIHHNKPPAHQSHPIMRKRKDHQAPQPGHGGHQLGLRDGTHPGTHHPPVHGHGRS